MKRVLVTVVAAVALAVAIVLPALGIQTDGSSSSDSEDTTITNYDADFRVAANGDLAVTEKLTVDFPGVGKHGIFRFFDRYDPSASTATTRARPAPCARRTTSTWRWTATPSPSTSPTSRTAGTSSRASGTRT